MISFTNKVVVVTGAGNGLGRAYALELAKRGAKLVVNDKGCAIDGSGSSDRAADRVVDEILTTGGSAVASYHSVDTAEEGQAIIGTAISNFGRIDALINNAGIISNASFSEMTAEQLNQVIATNLTGVLNVTQPAFRYMREQGYGRIVFTSSGAGLFGCRNEVNYASAKAALVGLSASLAIEGKADGVFCNIVSPAAKTRMEEGIRLEDIGADLAGFADIPENAPTLPDSAEYVVPLVTYLASDACQQTQMIYSAVKGRFARVFVGVADGWYGPAGRPATPEEIAEKMPLINDISTVHTPTSVFDELLLVHKESP